MPTQPLIDVSMTASQWRMDMPVRVLLEVEMFGNRSISISLIETHKYPYPETNGQDSRNPKIGRLNCPNMEAGSSLPVPSIFRVFSLAVSFLAAAMFVSREGCVDQVS